MLINLSEYHRPSSLPEALHLLQRRSPHTVPLAGGSTLVGSGSRDVEAVVDLQNLGMRYVKPSESGGLSLGSMATLGDIRFSDAIRGFAGGIVSQAARNSAGSVLRNQSTIGGTVATADGASELLVALLACDAQVSGYLPQHTELPLSEFLIQRDGLLEAAGLITEVHLNRPTGQTAAALERVARTPADSAIVCAAVVLTQADGICVRAGLAVGGVGPLPLRLSELEQLLIGQRLDDDTVQVVMQGSPLQLEPPGDFRGSPEYRKRMADVLTRRALQATIDRL